MLRMRDAELMRSWWLTVAALAVGGCYSGAPTGTPYMPGGDGDSESVADDGDDDDDDAVGTQGNDDGPVGDGPSDDDDDDDDNVPPGDDDDDDDDNVPPGDDDDDDDDDDVGTTGEPEPEPVEDCSADALELIALVNEYRGENGLPAIPASPSLCIVGDAHVQDLAVNEPHAPANCNLHSWSNAGAWSPCCYTPDHAAAECMWDKPSELTVYTGNGYENAAGGGFDLSPAEALELWKNSSGHNAVILNQGIWADNPWMALGAGVDQGYAVLWFGTDADPAG